VEEANLSRNIFMLRKALGESPQDRRYIVTVPGRGYRLAEDVQLVGEHELTIVAASHSKVEVQVAQTKPWGWITAAVILLLALGAGTLRFFLHPSPVLSEKDTVVLADFANSTGDPVFDETLRQGLSVQLEQSPFLSLISDGRIQHTLGLMGRPTDARVTPDLAREICERTGSAAVLEGSIASLGSQYVLGLRAKNCRTGESLDEEQVHAAKKEDVLDALSEIAIKFRTRVGESLATVGKYDTPLADATTPSLEALKEYSAAMKVLHTSAAEAALPLFKRAIELDPKFAIAHAYLGHSYGDIGESDLSANSTSTAYQLRDRASDREKFFIAATYDQQVTGNLEKAQETFELWERTYPRDIEPPGLLSGQIYPVFGKHEKAVEEAKKAIGLDPDFAFGYVNLATSYQFLGCLEEAEATLKQASDRKLEIPDGIAQGYDLAFVKGDQAEMERVSAVGHGKSGAEASISNKEAFVLAYSGHLQQARTRLQLAVDLAERAGQPERAAKLETGIALWDSFFGNAPAARRGAMEVLKLSKDRDVEYCAAFALALSGDAAGAQSVASDLEKRFPEDSAVRFTYLPVLRALLALNPGPQKQGEPAKAIERLQAAAPYELGVPLSWFAGLCGVLYPVYVRGEAYLAAHQGVEAAAEFQKILDHRGIVASDPIGALAHWRLGRAYAMQGETAKAKGAYQDFLALWKDADPDIPILKQAKAEYAKLQ